MVLIKYKDLSILVDEDADTSIVIRTLPDILKLKAYTDACFSDIDKMMNVNDSDVISARDLRDKLKSFVFKTGAIGYPFDLHDAELFALDRKIEYTILELK